MTATRWRRRAASAFALLLLLLNLALPWHDYDFKGHEKANDCAICLVAHGLDHPATASAEPQLPIIRCITSTETREVHRETFFDLRYQARAPPV
ncbi:MAG: hypothetical protein ACREXT_08925 [Gammaproteobacteria bacterium]